MTPRQRTHDLRRHQRYLARQLAKGACMGCNNPVAVRITMQDDQPKEVWAMRRCWVHMQQMRGYLMRFRIRHGLNRAYVQRLRRQVERMTKQLAVSKTMQWLTTLPVVRKNGQVIVTLPEAQWDAIQEALHD